MILKNVRMNGEEPKDQTKVRIAKKEESLNLIDSDI